MIEIKDIAGNTIASALETKDCKQYAELMALCYIELSWHDNKPRQLPAGASIEYRGERYRLLEPYAPEYVNEAEYLYKPRFYDKTAIWSKKPFFLVTDSGEETDWQMTAYPGQFMEVVKRALLKYTGETYTYAVDASIAQSSMEYIAFQNKSIFDGLTDIANAWETEWWVEGSVIHLSRCQYGSPVALEVGANVGIPSVTVNKEGYFTRFYAFGSTRNITQDYDDGGFTNGLVNKRLTLDPSVYPGGYIDLRANLKPEEIFVKTLIFDDIYPSSSLTISSVRADLKDYLDSDGNKIQVGTDAEGNPLYRQYAVWYFKIPGFVLNHSTYDKTDNPNGMLLPGLDLSVSFESGQLNGRDFKLTYHEETKVYEINFVEESGGIIVPGTVSLIPTDGDSIILYNIRIPSEYTSGAQERLAEATLAEIEKYRKDRNSYTVPSYPTVFSESGLDLKPGRAVTFKFSGGTLSSRVLKVEKQVDFPIQQTITIGEEKIKGNTQEIKEEVIDANQNIDVVKTLADLNKSITDGYGRVQQLIIESMSQYKGLWTLDQNGFPNDPTKWTVRTDYTAKSKGDVVAYAATDQEIQLPHAGYNMVGAVRIKENSGLVIDSATGLLSIDPVFGGKGKIYYAGDGLQLLNHAGTTDTQNEFAVKFGNAKGTVLEGDKLYGATWWGQKLNANGVATGAMTGVTSVNDLIYLHSNNSVGIGTTSPAEKLHVLGNIKGYNLLPSANGNYNLGSSSLRWKSLYLYGIYGNWLTGKDNATITIDSMSANTDNYFPILRWKDYKGVVFNIGAVQKDSNDKAAFGFFKYNADRTVNGVDAYFRMLGDGNMEGSHTLRMKGDVVAYAATDHDIVLPIAGTNTLGAVKVGSGLSISTDGTLSATGSGSVGNITVNGTGNVLTGVTQSSDKKTLLFTKDLVALTAENYAGTLDGRYVRKSGDTMTGKLNVNSQLEVSTSNTDILVTLNRTVPDNDNYPDAAMIFKVNGTSIGFVNGDLKKGTTLGNYVSHKNLNISNTGILTFGGDSVWHAGNDGSGSGLDADLLDGKEGLNYQRDVYTYINTGAIADSTSNPNILGLATGLGDSFYFFDTKFFQNASETSNRTQIAYPYGAVKQINYRQYYNGSWSNWNTLARTTDNVASATKLKTSRNLWGQPFDGQKDVSGDMTGVGSITMSGSIYLNNFGKIRSKDTTGEYLDLFQLSGSNNLIIGDGLCAKGYNSFLRGSILYFQTYDSSYQNRLTIIKNGNVGINTTSPAEKLHVAGNIKGYNLLPNATNNYDLGSSSLSWKKLYLHGLYGNWLSGKNTASIDIDSHSANTNHYFPILRWKDYKGVVFNIGAKQEDSNDKAAFGFFKYNADRTVNGVDAYFRMLGDGNMEGSHTLRMKGDVVAYAATDAPSPFKFWYPNVDTNGNISWTNSTSTTTPTTRNIRGPQGVQGPSGTITSVTASMANSSVGTPSVSVTLGGTASARTMAFSFSNLKGATGAQGPQGPAWDGGTVGNLTVGNNSTRGINIVGSGGSGEWASSFITLYVNGSGGQYWQMRASGNGDFSISKSNLNSNSRVFYLSGVNAGNAWIKGTLSQGSDMRMKNRLEGFEMDLHSLLNVDLFYYSLKDDNTGRRQIGLSAQQMKGILPIMVYGEGTGVNGDYYSYDYAKTGAILSIKSIQTFLPFVDQTNNWISKTKSWMTDKGKRIEDLEKEVSELKEKLNQLNAA